MRMVGIVSGKKSFFIQLFTTYTATLEITRWCKFWFLVMHRSSNIRFVLVVQVTFCTIKTILQVHDDGNEIITEKIRYVLQFFFDIGQKRGLYNNSLLRAILVSPISFRYFCYWHLVYGTLARIRNQDSSYWARIRHQGHKKILIRNTHTRFGSQVCGRLFALHNTYTTQQKKNNNLWTRRKF